MRRSQTPAHVQHAPDLLVLGRTDFTGTTRMSSDIGSVVHHPGPITLKRLRCRELSD